MSSVEEFWAKLKLANAPSKAREPAVAPKAPAAGIKSAADVPAKALGAQQSSAAADRGLQPSAVPQDPDAVKQQLTRDIEGLRSDSAPTRQKAASKLKVRAVRACCTLNERIFTCARTSECVLRVCALRRLQCCSSARTRRHGSCLFSRTSWKGRLARCSCDALTTRARDAASFASPASSQPCRYLNRAVAQSQPGQEC